MIASERHRIWEGFTFWPSFTDIIVVTLLVFLFFLFAQMTLSSEALRAGRMIKDQKAVAAEVVEALGADKQALTIRLDGQIQRFQFSDRILFRLGEAELLPSGRDVLRRVGAVLLRKADLFATLQVEGHTDVLQIKTPQFPSNWELSSARATSVVRFFQDEVGFDPRRLSATGYSEYRPVVSGTTEEAYSRNRRVELVVLYSLEKEGRPPRRS